MSKAIIFDMDGLMVNSTSTWGDAEKRLVEDYGKKYILEWTKKYNGMRVQGMIQVMIKEYELPTTQEEGERKLKEYAKINFNKPNIELLPGCERLVKELSTSKKYLMAIASSSPIEIIKTVVKRFGFENYFNVLLSGEEVVNGKPAPDVYLKTAELLKVSPSDCIVLEDAPNGIKAGKGAGMKVIAVSNKPHYSPSDFSEADKYVRSLEEVNVGLIESIFNS